jgi:hypothetical protein
MTAIAVLIWVSGWSAVMGRRVYASAVALALRL